VITLRVRLATIWIAIVAGLLLGFLTTPTVSASTQYSVQVNPGAVTNSMGCGWHKRRLAPFDSDNLSGYALDWNNVANDGIWWRSYGFRSAGSGSLGVARVMSNSSSGCKEFAVRVLSLNGTNRGSAFYTHATTSIVGTQWAINAGLAPGGSFTSYGSIGTTASSERENCSWTAAHLHQHSTSVSGWQRNTGVYYYAPSGGVGWNLNAVENWQNRSGTWAE
jgi:hypothetical protein